MSTRQIHVFVSHSWSQPRLKRLVTNVSNGVINPIPLQQGYLVEVFTKKGSTPFF